MVPISQMNVLRLNFLLLTMFKVVGGRRGCLHMATPSRQPRVTVRRPAAHQGLTAGAGHPQLTSSW